MSNSIPSRIILFNKPYHVLTQFTDRSGRSTLADYINVPNMYAAGRLDYTSEGLVVLTNAGWLQARIAEPRFKLAKTYWVHVEGMPTTEQIAALSSGVDLADGRTLPAQVRELKSPPVWPRTPPIRIRRVIPDAWLEISITEGRNRQVRRMTAAVGLPTLRLIRVGIGPWTIDGIAPGEWRDAAIEDLS